MHTRVRKRIGEYEVCQLVLGVEHEVSWPIDVYWAAPDRDTTQQRERVEIEHAHGVRIAIGNVAESASCGLEARSMIRKSARSVVSSCGARTADGQRRGHDE